MSDTSIPIHIPRYLRVQKPDFDTDTQALVVSFDRADGAWPPRRFVVDIAGAGAVHFEHRVFAGTLGIWVSTDAIDWDDPAIADPPSISFGVGVMLGLRTR